jgi:N-carbamoyl-L-amino-acid hydrolase
MSEGLDVDYDGVRNSIVTLQGENPDLPFVIIGSHLDSVPQGGNYDGAAGVVSGLLALICLRRMHLRPRRTVKLMGLRGEESAWFGKSWIGSHALFGLLSTADLALPRFDSGRPLREYMEDIGINVSTLDRQEKFLTPDAAAAYIEVHIEQGPVLETSGLPLGVVTGIRGNIRHMEVACRGTAAHSGATPRSLRHDAVVATADLIMRLDRCWEEYLAKGKTLVLTHGIMGTNPKEHAISRVPGETRFSIEIRADDPETLTAFHDLIRRETQRVADERGVTFTFDDPIVNLPQQMNRYWIECLERQCEKMGVGHMRIASGAGHDAAVFARMGIPTAMLFIRNFHGSHNPAEHMDMDDFLSATSVLAEILLDSE